MNNELLSCVEVEPSGPARSSVIWLHGLGADGHDFEPIVPLLRIPESSGVRFVFPNAPRIPVSINPQGGAIALHLGLRYPEKLAGIMALSSYLVCEDTLEQEIGGANRDTSLFQAHGTRDPMVPLDRGEAARDRLGELGVEVLWHSYPMMHEVCPGELEDIGNWLNRVLPAG
jgi:phospholipase/carboxylesterase